MKVILMFVLCFVSYSAVATEMCARNDTIVIPLDSNVGGSSNSYNQKEKA